MEDTVQFPSDFDVNSTLSQVEEAGSDILVYARNAQNADTKKEKLRWLDLLSDAIEKAEMRRDLAQSQI